MYKVKSRLKENGKLYNCGDEYKGQNSEQLLKTGAIEFVEDAKPEKKVAKKASKKVSKKKKSKKE